MNDLSWLASQLSPGAWAILLVMVVMGATIVWLVWKLLS